MVVEDGEAADGDGEVLGEEFEPGFDPGLAVRHALAAEKDPSHATGNVAAVAGDVDSGTKRTYPTAPAAGRQRLCLPFSAFRPHSAMPCDQKAIVAWMHRVIQGFLGEISLDRIPAPRLKRPGFIAITSWP